MGRTYLHVMDASLLAVNCFCSWVFPFTDYTYLKTQNGHLAEIILCQPKEIKRTYYRLLEFCKFAHPKELHMLAGNSMSLRAIAAALCAALQATDPLKMAR